MDHLMMARLYQSEGLNSFLEFDISYLCTFTFLPSLLTAHSYIPIKTISLTSEYNTVQRIAWSRPCGYNWAMSLAFGQFGWPPLLCFSYLNVAKFIQRYDLSIQPVCPVHFTVFLLSDFFWRTECWDDVSELTDLPQRDQRQQTGPSGRAASPVTLKRTPPTVCICLGEKRVGPTSFFLSFWLVQNLITVALAEVCTLSARPFFSCKS